MQRKPEQMHVPGGKASEPAQEQPVPEFTLKELIRLEGMKWLQEHGLQYESTREDGMNLYLWSSHPKP